MKAEVKFNLLQLVLFYKCCGEEYPYLPCGDRLVTAAGSGREEERVVSQISVKEILQTVSVQGWSSRHLVAAPV